MEACWWRAAGQTRLTLVITDDAHPLAGRIPTAEALSGQTSEEPVYIKPTEQGELVSRRTNCDRAGTLEVSQPVTLARAHPR